MRAIGATTEQTMNVRQRRGRDARRPGRRGAGRPLSPGSVLSAQRDRHQGAKAARAPRVDLPAIADALLARLAREAGVSPPPRLGGSTRARCSRATRFRATCASSRTCCTARRGAQRRRGDQPGSTSRCPRPCCPTRTLRAPGPPSRATPTRARSRRYRATTSTTPAPWPRRWAPAGWRLPARPRRPRSSRRRPIWPAIWTSNERVILVARAGAPELQPHRRRRQPRAVVAPDALPDGAARHHRVRDVRPDVSDVRPPAGARTAARSTEAS